MSVLRWSESASCRAEVDPHVQVRSFDAELILLDTKGGDYYAVADAGRDLVLRLVEGDSIEQAAHALHAEYDVVWPTLCDDVMSLVSDLVSRGLLVLRKVEAQ